MLAPEYGGDGGKAIGACGQKLAPLASFPAHWAPNDLVIYTGKSFPAHYRGGAFIAFHGSWDRAPYPQGGYNIAFQPLSTNAPAKRCEIFADGFAGAIKEPGRAEHSVPPDRPFRARQGDEVAVLRSVRHVISLISAVAHA